MEIRKRLTGKDIKKQFENEEMEELASPKNVESEDVIPGIPPRRRLHKKRRSAYSLPSLRSGVPIALGILLLVGGIWWFIEQDFFGEMVQQKTAMVEIAAPQPKPVLNENLKENQADPINGLKPVPEKKINVEPVHSQIKPTTEQAKPEKKLPVYSKIMKHKVGVGETLYRISLSYYQTGKFSSFLAKHNKIKNPADLVSGSVIEVPFPPN